MKIVIASDHAGFAMKETLRQFMKEQGWHVEDAGPTDEQRVDYPDFAAHACDLLHKGEAHRAVLICGSGIGMAMSANKVPGCRAAVLHNEWEAEMSRRHNDANVACFGARSMGIEVVQACLRRFIATEFEGGRHTGRVGKMGRLDGSITT